MEKERERGRESEREHNNFTEKKQWADKQCNQMLWLINLARGQSMTFEHGSSDCCFFQGHTDYWSVITNSVIILCNHLIGQKFCSWQTLASHSVGDGDGNSLHRYTLTLTDTLSSERGRSIIIDIWHTSIDDRMSFVSLCFFLLLLVLCVT